MPFVTQYQLSVYNLKQILMKNWHLIEKQPLLSEIYKKPKKKLKKNKIKIIKRKEIFNKDKNN